MPIHSGGSWRNEVRSKGCFLNKFDPKRQECFSKVYENIRWFLPGAQGLLPWPESLGKGQQLLIRGGGDVYHPHLPQISQILAFCMFVHSHIPMDSLLPRPSPQDGKMKKEEEEAW